MLNLSKINKVVLVSGILLAFSCAVSWTNSYAAGPGGTDPGLSDNDYDSGSGGYGYSDGSALGIDTSSGSGSSQSASASAPKNEPKQSRAQNRADKANDKASAARDTANQAIDENWKKANNAKNEAQNNYTQASVDYNECLAGGGDCSAKEEAMNKARENLDNATKEYNKAQKATSKAENKAIKEENKALNKAEKAEKKAQKALDRCKKKEGADCSAEEAALEAAQASLKEAQDRVDARNGTSSGSGDTGNNVDPLEQMKKNINSAGNSKNASALSKNMSDLKALSDAKAAASAAADAECRRYSAMTSGAAQAKAKEACALAKQLKGEAKTYSDAYNSLLETYKDLLPKGVAAAEKRLKYGGDFKAFSEQPAAWAVNEGTHGGNFAYDSTGDVLETVTRRAAFVIVNLKPIVYIFAGFGLIAFAWMAIFNKLSWKWFANIAMGLFLVANMGRLIEYFVGQNSDKYDNYYNIGAWKNGADGTGKSADNRLAAAFNDVYYVYGDTLEDGENRGIRDWKTDVNQPVAEEFTASAAGFCQGTSGSGWANFKSCIGDIVSTAKKVANTAQTVASTAQDMYARYESVKDNVANIKQAAEAMKGGSITDIISGMGNILNNVNSAVSTTTGAVGSLTNAASSVSNNIQDMGKSVDQQKELQDRRNRGEATNAVDAALKGQEWNSAAGGVENVDGEYASKDNFITGANDWADKIKNESGALNSSIQDGLMQAGTVTDVVENFSIGGSKSINDARREKQEQEHQRQVQENLIGQQAANEQYREEVARENQRREMEDQLAYEEEQAAKRLEQEALMAEQEYEQAQSEANSLYTEINAQEHEVSRLEEETKNKQDAAQKACAEDPDGPVCSTAKLAADTAKDALENKKEQLDRTKDEYNKAKEKAEEAYQDSLKANQNQAQRDLENAQKTAEEANKRLEEVNGKIDDAASAADSAKSDYDKAVKEAQEARDAYNKALEEGKSPEELERLKQAYDDKLTVMSDKKSDYDKKSQEYNDLSQQQKDARKAYDDAHSKANDAAERLNSYTDEDVNKTGDSRLNSSEDIDNQMLIDQYESETNPNAEAQASKNSYIERKNKTDVAKYTLEEKEGVARQAYNDYQAAAKKCQQTGSAEDCRLADRLKNNYDLASNEVNAAKQEYDDLNRELSGYERDYKQKALNSEKYKQKTYESEMRKASADINQYEVQVSRQRQVVDDAAMKYTQAKNSLQEGDQAGLAHAAQLYNEYKAAKDLYDSYQSSLNQAKNNYATAQSNYQKSVAEAQRLEKELSGM